MSNDDKVAGLVAFILGPFLALYESWILSKLWEWFVAVPFGIIEIKTFHIFGLLMFCGIIKLRYKDIEDAPDNPLEGLIVLGLAYSFLFLLGWIAYHVMT